MCGTVQGFTLPEPAVLFSTSTRASRILSKQMASAAPDVADGAKNRKSYASSTPATWPYAFAAIATLKMALASGSAGK